MDQLPMFAPAPAPDELGPATWDPCMDCGNRECTCSRSARPARSRTATATIRRNTPKRQRHVLEDAATPAEQLVALAARERELEKERQELAMLRREALVAYMADHTTAELCRLLKIGRTRGSQLTKWAGLR